LKITTKVSPLTFINWTPQERQIKQKCHCGKFACIGYPAQYGNLELLCFKHYEERKQQCQKEWGHTEVKEADHRKKNQLNLL